MAGRWLVAGRVVAPLGALALAAGACGGGFGSAFPTGHTSSSVATSGSSVPPTTHATTSSGGGTTSSHPGSSASGARQALAAAYDATTQSATAHFSVIVTVVGTATGTSTVAMHGATTLAGTSPSLRARAVIPSLGTVKMRVVGGTEYVGLPPSASGLLPAGKTWLSTNLSQLSGSLGSLAPASAAVPANVLGILGAEATDVTKVGSATIQGVATTEYRANLDLSKPAGHASPEAQSALSKAAATLHATTLPVRVWLDSANRVRRIRLTFTLPAGTSAGRTTGPTTVRTSMNFFDYGVPVHVSPPPPNEVATAPLGSASTTGGAAA